MNLSDSPERPACPSRASGWSSLTTPWGLPCCVRFPCVHAVATTPAQQLGPCFARSPSRISLPRKGDRVGLRIVLFEACSAFTRVTACTLVKSPFVTRCIEGFSHFVTSMTSPITSGGSNRRVGLSPTGKAPPYHGAHPKQSYPLRQRWLVLCLAFSRTPVRWRSQISSGSSTKGSCVCGTTISNVHGSPSLPILAA